MARHINQTLTKLSPPTSKLFPNSLSSRFVSSKAQLIEVDLDSSSSSSGDGELEVFGSMKKLEDVIHGIIVRRLAPDWLPFRPGSSYWVPPKRHAENIVENLTNPLTEEESLSLSSARGWPCSSVFLDGSVFEHPIPVEVEVQVHVQSSPKKTSSEDEEK